ncbi:MAG: LPD38 domain-containing protein [Zoogloea oleivorans]|jgi:N12 class adenine-specific DNA methylase|uniref:LPD38 domain-containing protein n=1 Tax=Zoogloea oleivorans TaxID=1552750 RepID=UPI002A368188|nr:LPD38 domain-containing protein [Zoogloea oleivorans]MDY0036719.1 LPD38 domain-containing protein [Zoogloea oleivorans]
MGLFDDLKTPADDVVSPGTPAQSRTGLFDSLKKAEPEGRGFLGHARDLGLSAVKSAIAVPETIVGLADIPTGGRVGKFLENEGGAFGFRPHEAKEFLSELHTDQHKANQREFQEADGVLAKTAVALQNPSLIANTVTESLAPMLTGGVAARGLMATTRLGQAGARAAARGADAAQQAQAAGRAAALAGAIGEGAVMAGAQASAIRNETEDRLLTPVQSGAAVATGALGSLFGYAGGRIAQRYGFGDIDTMLAQGVPPRAIAGEIARTPAKSIPRNVIEGAITEGFLEELPQSVSEQIIQNLALGKTWSDGVEDAAVMGTLAGMAMGGGASLYKGMSDRGAAQSEDAGQQDEGPAGLLPAPASTGTPSDQLRQVEAERASAVAAAEARAQELYRQRAEVEAARMGIDPAGGPTQGAAFLALREKALSNPQSFGAMDELAQFIGEERADIERRRQPQTGEATGVDAGFDPRNRLRNQVPDAPRGNFGDVNELADLIADERSDLDRRRAQAQIDQQADFDALVASEMADQDARIRGISAQQAERRAIQTADADQRTADAQAREADQRRRAVLDSVLDDPAVANHADRFAAELRRQGYRDADLTDAERQRIARFNDLLAAEPAGPEIEPSAPNEMDAAGLGIRERGARQRMAQQQQEAARQRRAELVQQSAQEAPAGEQATSIAGQIEAAQSPEQVRDILRRAEADDVVQALVGRPDLDQVAQSGLSAGAWDMLRGELLTARGQQAQPPGQVTPPGAQQAEAATAPSQAAAQGAQPQAPSPQAPPDFERGFSRLLQATGGNGDPSGLAGPDNLQARTEIVAALTGREVADIEADPRHRFVTSVQNVEKLLHEAAGVQGGIRERRAAFIDYVDRRLAGAGAQQAGGSSNGVQSAAAAVPDNGAAQNSPAADQGGQVEDLRRQLREVESKILAAAPDAMGSGGGDIEAAMKSRKVPVTLKAQRKRIQDQLRQVSATFSQEAQPARADAQPAADRPQQSPAPEAGKQDGKTSARNPADRRRDDYAQRHPFRAFLGRHGISLQDQSDVMGERGSRRANRMIPFFGPVFRRNGLRLDELAVFAVQDGFLTQAELDSQTDNGGTRRLTEMIQSELIHDQPQARLSDMESGLEEQARNEEMIGMSQMLEAVGIDTADMRTYDQLSDALESEAYEAAFAGTVNALLMDARWNGAVARQALAEDVAYNEDISDSQARIAIANEIDEAAVERAAIQSDDDVDFLIRVEEVIRNADQQAYAAATDRYRREAEERSRRSGGAQGREGGRTEGVPRDQAGERAQGSSEQGGLTLESYTPDDLAEREAAQREREEAEARAEREAAERDRKAREREEIRQRSEAAASTFELGGDPLDNLTGQGGLFGQQAPADQAPTTQTAETPAARWQSMTPDQRQDALAAAGYVTAKGAPNVVAAANKSREWDALGEKVRSRLAGSMGQQEPQAAATEAEPAGATPEAGEPAAHQPDKPEIATRLNDITEPSITRRANPGNMGDQQYVARAFLKDGDVPIMGVSQSEADALLDMMRDADRKRTIKPAKVGTTQRQAGESAEQPAQAPAITSENGKYSQRVSSIYGNGTPDERNSMPMQELDGFKVGDRVKVKGRTVNDATIELLFTRSLPGFDTPDSMARIRPANGGSLMDVQTHLLETANIQRNMDAASPAPAQEGKASGQESEKAKWIKATVDKSRLNGSGGVQIAVAPNGGVTFIGDPNTSKDGRALLANYEKALAAGATQQEIAAALQAQQAKAPAAALQPKAPAITSEKWVRDALDPFEGMKLPDQLKEYLLKPSVTMKDGSTVSPKDFVDGLLANGYGNPEYFAAAKGSQAGFLSKPGSPRVTLNDKQMFYADAAFMAKKQMQKKQERAGQPQVQQGQQPTQATDDDIDAMFDDALADVIGEQQTGEAEPAADAVATEQPANQEAMVESLEDELRAQKKRVQRLRGGDATKIKEAETRLRAMRQSIFDAEDKWVPAARNGDQEALAKLEEAGFIDTADAIRAFAPAAPRTAGKSLKSAAKNAASALDDAINGLGKLFGGGGRLSSGLTFDEETYAKAKPLFIAAAANIRAASRDLRDVMKAVVGMVVERFGADTAKNMKPYVTQFVKDVRDGKVQLEQEQGGDDRAHATVQNESSAAAVAQQEETDNAGAAIYGAGAAPLGTVATQDDRGNARSGNAESRSAEGEQGSRATGGRSDDGGNAEARGRGNGPAGSDSAEAGAGGRGRGRRVAPKSQKPRKAASAQQELKEEAAEDIRQASPINIPALDFVITDEVELGKGTESVKFSDNLAAIRVLKQIEQENRRASPEEQRTLARYVGWGGLKNAFRVAGAGADKGVAKGWESRVAELEALLTPAELRAARNSTTAAHYTSQTVVEAVWKGVERLGFRGGAVLEPSVGTGNFLGLMPANLRGNAKVLAAEYDSLTARIAQQLYPNQSILHSGFQDIPLPDNKFALAIGNPPFGRESLYFRHNPSINGKSIHNQFFLQSIQSVETDGLMGMVVSHNLMDAQDQSSRLDMAVRAEFLGAVRLPDTAFKENARTEVVTDILFFRKRGIIEMNHAVTASRILREGEGKQAATLKDFSNDDVSRIESILAEMQRWVPSSKQENFAGSGETISVNPYFMENPAMVVGTMDASGTMNARADLNVRLDDPSTFAQRLNQAIERLPLREPADGVAQRTMAQFEQMATGMRLAVARAEPGAIRRTPDGVLKVVVEMDDLAQDRKTILNEIDLTAQTPFNEEYTLRTDGAWQREVDIKGADGKPLKKLKPDGTPSTFNQKEIVTYDSLDKIPEKDRWGANRIAVVTDMLPVRDALKRQLMLEASDAPPAMIEAHRKRLNAAYDDFKKKHGDLHKAGNAKIAMTMPDGALALAVEDVDEDGKVSRAAILSRRVTVPPKPVERANSAGDAVAVVLAETGRIDIERVARLLGTDEKGAAAALSEGDSPRAFFDPETNQWEPADGYLSGLVRRKLLAAKAAGLEKNVAALERVQPEAWDSTQITPTMGSAWIPPEVYADFLKHLGFSRSAVTYLPATNTFSVVTTGSAKAEWTPSQNALSTSEIVERTLNSRPVKVTRKDQDGKTWVDEEATLESQMKATEIANEFLDWAFADDALRDRLVEVFNEKFNTRVVRQRDGSFLTLPGKVADAIIKMRPWQLNAIWRGITDSAVLYDHAVGAGKTYTAIARAMERRRMGLSKKPMIVVPNHLVEQWAADVKKLYPGANILAAGKLDFDKQRRRRLFARIGAGDYDMVIVGHSSFQFIDIDPATEERYLDEELRIAYEAVQEAQEAAEAAGFSGWGKPMGVAEAERLVKRLEERLAKVRDSKRDRLLTFEEMGIDDLTIDEAHEFKNLAYSSNLQGTAGMGNKTGSAKAMDLNLKLRSLRERPGTSVAFLTGTPISNSVAEMYLVLKNLVPNELAELGMENFDAWRTTFVSASSAYEPTESGSLKEVTRLGREWMNMKSLMDLYYTVADAVTLQDMKDDFERANPGNSFPVPRVRSQIDGKGDREMVAIKPGEAQRAELRTIVAGFDGLPEIEDRKERNKERLRLMDRARKVSLDARAVNPHAQVPDGEGKIGAVVNNVFATYEKWDADRGTQLIFLDRSVPKSSGDKKIIDAYDKLVSDLEKATNKGDEKEVAKITEKLEKYNVNEIAELRNAQNGGWNAYAEIKRQLVAKGIPANEIRFVQEANTDKQKADLFALVKSGDVRVLIGSTPRMGAGTNVQDRLVSLHHVDVTWKPSDIEQREGRIVRQGNKLLEKYGDEFAVDVIAYATEMTVDAKMWSLNATKLKAINGIRKYDGSFMMEFDDEESASMAEMAALATGNPLMVERVTLDGDIKKLEMAQRTFNRRMNGIRSQIASAERTLKSGPQWVQTLRTFAQDIEGKLAGVKERSSARRVTVNGKEYASKDEADLAVTASIEAQQAQTESGKGRYVVEVNGEKATSRDRISALIHGSMGDPDFEAEVGGEKMIDLNSAVRAILERRGSGREYTIDGITLNGMRVEIDVAPNTWRPDTDSTATVSVLDRDGKSVMERWHYFESPVLSGPSLRAALQKALGALDPRGIRADAESQERDIARAERDLPDLKAQAEKTFPQAGELIQKRDRLQQVVAALKAVSDLSRIGAENAELAADGEAANADAAAATMEVEDQAAGNHLRNADGANPDIRFSFAGRTAQTADQYALAAAQRRIALGENAETVRQDTGWHRGNDGKWRFEISDDQARVAVGGANAAEIYDAALLDGEVVRVADVLDHPQLFAAYPHLADVRVELLPAVIRAQARYQHSAHTGAGRLQINPRIKREAMAKTLLHELQHGIQFREGFAVGGSPEAFASDSEEQGADTYRRLAGEVEARNVETRRQMTPEQRRAIAPDYTSDTMPGDVLVTFNGKRIVTPPHNAKSRMPVTESGLMRAMRRQFPGLAGGVEQMLARGRQGKKGGLVMVDSADPLQIARVFAERTGRSMDESIRLFSEDGVINGIYDPRTGLTFLVGPNLDPVTAPAVLLHESVHGQQREKTDAQAMDMLTNRMEEENESTREFLDRAAQRMARAGAATDSKEAAPYIVEQAIIEGRSAGYKMADSRFFAWADRTLGKKIGDFLRSVAAGLRTWMIRNGWVKELTVDDLVGYAMAGVGRAAEGNVRASSDAGRMSSVSERGRAASEQGAADSGADSIQFSRAGRSAAQTILDAGDAAVARADGWLDRSTRTPEGWSDEQKAAASKFATFSPKQPIKSMLRGINNRLKDRAAQLIFDQFRPLMKVSKEAFMTAHLSKATDGALEAIAMHGLPVLRDGALAVDKQAGGGFLSDLAGLGSAQEANQFLMWVAANRADALSKEWVVRDGTKVERYKSEADARKATQGRPSAKAEPASRENLFTPDDIAAMKAFSQGTLPDGRSRTVAYAKMHARLNAYNKAVLDIAEKAGLINAEGRKTWESEFYIPFYRVSEDTGGMDFSTGGTGLARQKVIRQLKGGTENLGDPLANIMSNWHMMLTSSMRNMAANKALEQGATMGIAERVAVPALAVPAAKGGTWTMKDGQKVLWQVHDPMVEEALEALNFTGYNNPAMRAAGKFKHMLTIGVTISPTFRIRNLMRDALQAVATADVGYNPMKNAVEGWKLTSRDSDTMAQLMAGGGAVRFGAFNDGQQAEHAKRMIAMGIRDNQILSTPEKMKNFFRRLYDGYQETGDRAETINRAVIYQRVLAETGSHLEASFAARDLMNFTSMGSSAAIRALAQVLPFFNARLQGMDRLVRGAAADPRRFWSVAGVIGMASALLYLLQADDDEYKALPDYVRDTYWPVKMGGTWAYIPKPFEVGALGTVVERFTELMMAGDDYRAKDFRDTMVGVLTNTLALNPVPQIVKPIGEVWFNYDMFRGQAIDSMAMERLLPQERFNANTSAAAVGVGRALDVSPQKVEHMVRGYFGWLGTQALNVGDLMARPFMDMPASPRRDMTQVNNWLVAGDLFKEAGTTPSKYTERFYRVQREINAIYATASQARRLGDMEQYRELMSRPEMAARPMIVKANRQITEINQQMRAVMADRNMSVADKSRRLSELRTRRDGISRSVDERARQGA